MPALTSNINTFFVTHDKVVRFVALAKQNPSSSERSHSLVRNVNKKDHTFSRPPQAVWFVYRRLRYIKDWLCQNLIRNSGGWPISKRDHAIRMRIGHVRYVWPRRDGTGSNTPSRGRVDYLAYCGCFGVSQTKI